VPRLRPEQPVGWPILVAFCATVWAFDFFDAASPVPIRHGLSQIVTWDLAISSGAGPSSFRARGVRGTQHSVQVADAGSTPAGSILPVVVEKFMEEKTQR
jgi:hypothetical protein